MSDQEPKTDPGQNIIGNETSSQPVTAEMGEGTLSVPHQHPPSSTITDSQQDAPVTEKKHKKHSSKGSIVSGVETKTKRHKHKKVSEHTPANLQVSTNENVETHTQVESESKPAKSQRSASSGKSKTKSKRQRRKKLGEGTSSQPPSTPTILSGLQCYVLASGDSLATNPPVQAGVFPIPSTSANLVHYIITSRQMPIRSELGEGTSSQSHSVANLLRYVPVEAKNQSQNDSQATSNMGGSAPSTSASNILCYEAAAPLIYDSRQTFNYHPLPSTSTSSQIYIPARGDSLSTEAKQLIDKYKNSDGNERSKLNPKQQHTRKRNPRRSDTLDERTFRPIAPLPSSEPPPLRQLTVKPKIKSSTTSSAKSSRMCESPVLEYKKMKIEPKFYQVTRKPERLKQKKIKPEPGDSRSHTHHVQQQSAALAPIIIDSGGHTIKMGLATDTAPSIIPNAIMKVKSEKKRLFIGNQIEECRDLSGLYFLLPCERGYITKWEVQKPIWDYAFNKGLSIEDRCVIVTQPPFNFKSIQDCLDELFFEDYEVKAMYRANPTDLTRYEYSANVIKADEPSLVVDSGFSFTHIMPYIEGRKYYKGIKRVNVGGKFLTNYLRDIISYRMYDVMEETYVINQVKEDCVFVSMDVREELRKAKLPSGQNPISINYVLPDFNMIRRGYIQNMNEKDEIAENCQILRLNNERFTVPELLFNPKDIGMTSIGVAEAIAKSILSCPESVRPSLAKNIILTGGNVRIPGFEQRLQVEVRSFLPEMYTLKTYKPDNPVTFAWQGGKSLAHDPRFKQLIVTKQEYEEHGSKITYERFNAWTYIADDAPPKPVECVPINYLEHLKLNSNVFDKDDETPFVSEERPTFIEDPGEGPSSRSDIIAPVAIRPEEDEKSVSSMASEDDATRSSDPSAKSTKVSAKKEDDDNTEENLGDMIRDAEMEAMMECVKAYI